MGRLVRIPQRVSIPADRAGAGTGERPAGRATSQVTEQDDYLTRIAKYVPAEVLAFSVLINAILDQAMRAGGKTAVMAGMPVMTIAVAALVVGTIMAPFYVWYVHEEDDAWITNACVSFVAFPFWAYAMGAVAFTDIRDGNLAAILLASFTVASGLIKPLPVDVPQAQEVKQPETTETTETVARAAPPPAPAPAGPRLVDLTTAINMPGP
jgi:hypothetical protein